MVGFCPDEWHGTTEEDLQQKAEGSDFAPPKGQPLARPSDIIGRNMRNRFLCRCVECEGPMPHHTPDMICARCCRQLEADLVRFDQFKGTPHD